MNENFRGLFGLDGKQNLYTNLIYVDLHNG